MKAHLCAKGFQEIQDFHTDSPTCSHESIWLALAVIASMQWTLCSVDIQAAFLQGTSIGCTVFIKPPPEANTNKIWQLKKCICRLADARHHFYHRMREELIKRGATPSKLDQGLFYWLEDGHLAAILVCHVDDILWGGTPRFKSAVIDNLSSALKFGAEHSSAFTCIGIQLGQHSDSSITLNQNNFAASIKRITLSATSDANTLLTDTERTALCSAIGQLNWLAGISMPDISFEICNVASKVKEATIHDVIQINKVITTVQSEETYCDLPIS